MKVTQSRNFPLDGNTGRSERVLFRQITVFQIAEKVKLRLENLFMLDLYFWHGSAFRILTNLSFLFFLQLRHWHWVRDKTNDWNKGTFSEIRACSRLSFWASYLTIHDLWFMKKTPTGRWVGPVERRDTRIMSLVL